ncbi:C40 family peptidase [Glycomyces salinus]|uniref:C40 family peptidase n=1 Tax=Glycomyces salinus TaxID=980294 RepID=UPI0018EC5AE8|nr:NlpC/P60 family protein [Glycomyces salinus]
MKIRRLVTLVTAIAALLVTSLSMAAPANAATPLPNPSVSTTLSCGGAKVHLQIAWRGADKARIYWKVWDTDRNGRSPVLRIVAFQSDYTYTSFQFRTGKPYFKFGGGAGNSTTGGVSEWNPSGVGRVNHIKLKIKDGSESEGTECRAARKLFNWTRIAYANALQQEGDPYRLGAEGPDAFDCSGLVFNSYNRIGHFTDWPVRTANDMYNWAVNNQGSIGKVYTRQIPFSELKRGDLIFYNTVPGNDRYIDHVAFYTGNGVIFDAQQPGVDVGYHNDYTNSRVAAFRIQGKTNA